MWDALTWQGKTLVVSVLAFVVIVFLLISGRSKSPEQPRVALALTTIPQIAIATSAPVPGVTSTAPAAQPTLPTSSTPTPVQAPATSTSAPPTAAPAAPTTAPLPATAVPATPTAAPLPTDVPTAVPAGCTASVTVSNQTPAAGSIITVGARLQCGAGIGFGAQMTAVVTSPQGAQSKCSTFSDATGAAACHVQLPATAAGANSVSACFSNQGDLVCAQANFTAH